MGLVWESRAGESVWKEAELFCFLPLHEQKSGGI